MLVNYFLMKFGSGSADKILKDSHRLGLNEAILSGQAYYG
jgi:hypothetical protein